MLAPLQPVVLIGYGMEGAGWLSELVGSTRAVRLDAPFEEWSDLVQFWAVGLDPEEHQEDLEGIVVMPAAVESAHLRDQLNVSRQQRLVTRFPSLAVNSVLVLERWSPIHTPVDVRLRLHRGLDRSRRVAFQAEAAREVGYEWIALGDCVRPAGPLSKPRAEDVCRHFEDQDLLTDLNLLVDRENEHGAVVTEREADGSLASVASAIVLSSLAGSRSLQRITDTDRDSDDDARSVHGVSVVSFAHGSRAWRDVANERLSTRLRMAKLPYETVQELGGSLAECVRSDLNAGRQPETTSSDRQAALESALAHGMASRRLGLERPWQQLDEARSILSETSGLRNDGRPSQDPPEDPARNAQLSLWERLLAFLRRLGILSPDEAQSEPAVSDHGSGRSKESQGEDWEEMLRRASVAQSAWESWLFSEAPGDTSKSVWNRDEGEFVLAGWPGDGDSGEEPVPPAYWVDLGRELLSLAGEGREDPELVQKALGRLSERLVIGRTDAGRDKLSTRALQCAPIEAELDSPLSIYCGHKYQAHWVFWFHGLDSAPDGFPDSLEPALRPTTIHEVTTGDPGRTVRVAVGETMLWSDVLSLRANEGSPKSDEGT